MLGLKDEIKVLGGCRANMLEELIKEIELLKKKENLLIRLTNQLSSYLAWTDKKDISNVHMCCIEKILKEYYDLVYDENQTLND